MKGMVQAKKRKERKGQTPEQKFWLYGLEWA